jgi:hypothetical protein
MDVSSEIRPLFNRISVDFAQMIKRSDVSYYVKLSSNAEPGNDLIAFFSLVDGFYPGSTTAEAKQPQTSVISYRVNAEYQLERMAKSLPFAGQATQTPLVFGPTYTLATQWPTAVSNASSDPDYNIAGADVFRFEFYYLLKAGGSTSIAPWPSMAQVKMADIAAIAVAVAVIDPKSRRLLSSGEATHNDNIKAVAATMVDYAPSMGTTGLFADPANGWQTAVDNLAGGSSPLPVAARTGVRGVRLYQRIIPL